MAIPLNPAQQAAVRHIDGPLLVLAGAGSGKTRVITHKIAHLIKQGLDPRHIVAVTFTNKASREMKQRVATLLKGEAKGVRISTFHTLGLEILRKEAKAAGYKPGFTIIDARDGLQLLRELIPGGGDVKVDRVQGLISSWKNALVSPEKALERATDPLDAAAARAFAAYNRQLQAYNALDFDDLILVPLRLFEGHPECLARWRHRLEHLLVDEYQDTNACQYQLVKCLVGERGQLTAVGDDDQSIYAWRGAQPENLQLLQEDFPRLKIVKLEQNYRSAQAILDVANHLIGHNPRLVEKRLWSELRGNECLRIIPCDSGDAEAERVVAEIIQHRFKGGYRYGDYAILYRSNHQAHPVEQQLRQQRIPYRLSGGNSFFDHAEVKDLLAYLRLLVNPDDDAAFLRIANVPRREIGPTTLEKLARYASGRDKSLLDASFELGLGQFLGAKAHGRLEQFARLVVETGDRAERGDPLAAVAELIQAIAYRGWLGEQCDDKRVAERRLKNVDALLGWLGRMDEDATLAERVAKMTLMDTLNRQEGDRDPDAVALMTLHAAKGLEFPHVFIIGLEDDVLPHRNSLADERSLAEERRLLYVGVTRAQRSLALTLAKRRKRYGEWVDCTPSRFLDELPKSMGWEGGKATVSPAERQARGRAQLAHLKAMLAGTK
ncbi:MAG: UvrD-helicase domain-containing protein [Candidatus Competibacterales bacterium]